jgi:hypothetical protein
VYWGGRACDDNKRIRRAMLRRGKGGDEKGHED